MDLLTRIVGGVLGMLAFTLLVLMVNGQDTVMGRALEHADPGFFTSGVRICYVRHAVLVDITRDPPEFLGVDSAGAAEAAARSLESRHTATLTVAGRRWIGEGFWFPTRHGVRTVLEVSADAMHSPDIAGIVFDHELREKVRAVALVGIRRDEPEHPWLRPAGLEAAPFLDHNRTEPRRTTGVLWSGYMGNGMTLLALAVVVWAFWPRRSRRALGVVA